MTPLQGHLRRNQNEALLNVDHAIRMLKSYRADVPLLVLRRMTAELERVRRKIAALDFEAVEGVAGPQTIPDKGDLA